MDREEPTRLSTIFDTSAHIDNSPSVSNKIKALQQATRTKRKQDRLERELTILENIYNHLRRPASTAPTVTMLGSLPS
jgi:hypothetical protein